MPTKKVQIFYIYSEHCDSCKKALETVEKAIKVSKIPCEILKFKYNTNVAVNIAMNNDIDDLPGFVVGAGQGVFKGTNYTEAKIVEAIKKAHDVEINN